jgi:hypothetical protein
MKICYVNSRNFSELPGTCSWAETLSCDEFHIDDFMEMCKHHLPYDFIITGVHPRNFSSIRKIRNVLKFFPGTRLILLINDVLKEDCDVDKWSRYLGMGDVLVASDEMVARSLRQLTSIRPMVLGPALDTEILKEQIKNVQKTTVSVIAEGPYNYFKLLCDTGFPVFIWLMIRYRIRFVNPRNADKLKKSISESFIVFMPEIVRDGGFTAVCSALAGAVLVSPAGYEGGKICFPDAMFDRRHNQIKNLFHRILFSNSFRIFIRDSALFSSVRFNKSNKAHQFLTKAGYKVHLPDSGITRNTDQSLADQIVLISGPVRIDYSINECVIVCVLKNNKEYLDSFLKHYRNLGIRHFIFIDNNSEDGTADFLLQYTDVTLYSTNLPVKYYEYEIRRLIIEKHCRNRWCLNINADELFDYPSSEKLPLYGLLEYLSSNKFTAMACHILRMYGDNRNSPTLANSGLKLTYPCYNISSIEKKDYFSPDVIAFCSNNELSDQALKCYSYGIRKTFFSRDSSRNSFLTRHPLVFLDGFLEPVTNSHFCDNARVADITGVLFHYKSESSFRDTVGATIHSSKDVKNPQYQFEQFFRNHSSVEQFTRKTQGTRVLGSVNELVEAEFISSPQKYRIFYEIWNQSQQIRIAI